MKKLKLDEVKDLAKNLLKEVKKKGNIVYGVPRGGLSVALILQSLDPEIKITEDAYEADVIIDDIIDSGATKNRYREKLPYKSFMTLLPKSDEWVQFPWEVNEGAITDNITRIIQFVGDDPNREGLLETPKRVVKAWEHWTSGYNKDPADILKVFEDGAEGSDNMIIVKDIPFYSKCEHHLADIFGVATIAYIPSGKIVGLSKLSRLLDIYARRLQVQERLTNQVADALEKHLNPLGVGVLIKARHMCMESRGICQQGHHTITSALRGVMRDKPETRAEFMELAK